MSNFKFERMRKRVRVMNNDNNWSTTPSQTQVDEITQWVNETQCGKRVAYNIWRMNDKACVALFILRWS